MLDLSTVDLGSIAMAFEDHSDLGSWWIDGQTGEVWHWGQDDHDAAFDPDERDDPRGIQPLPSTVAYRDMQDFIDRVPDRRAADLLHRAIAGRGAFRRFKDTLLEFPDLRDEWFRFVDVRMQRRAIEFLLEEGLIDEEAGDGALAGCEDSPVGGGVARSDPRALAEAVAAELRGLYGERLVEVVLFGSQARGHAHPDSDVDLAVILDEVASPWEELRHMDEILWRYTIESGLTVSATPLSKVAWAAAGPPVVRAARTEGVSVG